MTVLSTASFEAFEADARAQGFDEVLVREWSAGLVLDEHTHPFEVQARVTRGELWLTRGGHTQHLQAGDGFQLERGAPHAERYGLQGATFWVARRHGPGSGTASP